MVSANNSTPLAGRKSWSGSIFSGWQSLPLRWNWLSLMAAWLLLFQFLGNSTLGYTNTPSLFGWWAWVHTRGMWNADGSLNLSLFLESDNVHAWLVPIVVVALLWSRRQTLQALPKRVWWPAFGIVVLAVLLHVLGFMIQQTRLSVIGFFLGIYGLMGWCWGPAWLRECLFPFLLFVFCVPLPNSGEFITFHLRTLSAELSTFLSKWFLGLDVYREGTQILSANRRFQYDVAPACSGIRSLVTLLALTTIFGYLTFTKLWKRLLMVALAAPLAVAGNTLRITCAVLVGEVFGHEAGATVEQKLGFLTFLLALAVLLLVAHWLREDRTPVPAKSMTTPPAESAARPPSSTV